MRKFIFAAAIFLLLSDPVSAQSQAVNAGAALPSTCLTGDVYVTTGSTPTISKCNPANTWTPVSVTSGGDVSTAGQVTATHLASALPVAQGGTGLATLTAHALYVGNGTTAPTALAVCGTGVYVRGVAASDPICSTLVLPNAATQGDLLTATGSNTIGSVTAVAAGSYLRSNGTSAVPIYSTLILPNTASAGTYLIATTSNTVIAVAPALNKAQPADQVARSSSGAFVMMGLGAAGAPCTITPVATGRVVFTISGDIVNNTTATTVTVQMAEGTGTAPSNNGAAAGTVISAAPVSSGVTNALTQPFSITSSATGLALSTAVWFDLQLKTSSTNTGQPTNITCIAHEI